MNPTYDSSQVKKCFNGPTPSSNYRNSLKRTDSETDKSVEKVNPPKDSEEADEEISKSNEAELTVQSLTIADPKRGDGKGDKGLPLVSKEVIPNAADQNLNAMGLSEGRLAGGSSGGSRSAASNGAASPETSSNRAPPKQHSVKRKHSETSYGEGAGRGPHSDTGEKLKREPEFCTDPGDLHPDKNHTVLIDTMKFRCDLFEPYKGHPYVWDNEHVKLPQNFPTKGKEESRWEATMNALISLTKSKTRSRDVELAIMSYNHSYQREWKFDALHSYVKQLQECEQLHFSTLISKMALLAVHLPYYIQHAIPLLKQNRTHAITLSQGQISSLLANAFFCTFPHRNSTKPNSEYANFPTINFNSLYCEPSTRKIQKLRSLFNYFNTVTTEEPKGLVTFQRICIPRDKLPNWKKRTEMLTHLQVCSDGSIEKEGQGLLQVDFAAKYVGGGVLGRGLVQEEIRFLMCPELIVARLFTEKLGDNECLKITGAQTYSDSIGYSDSFEWLGPHTDNTKRDKWKRRMCQIVAIDALHFRNPKDQYTKENVQRELNKAYVGFRRDTDRSPDIATGNWGCGAFNGDPELKALIQMMAAAVAGRSLAFFTFGNRRQAQELQQIHEFLKAKRVSVARLYTLLVRYCEEKQHYKSKSVFNYIREKNGSACSHL